MPSLNDMFPSKWLSAADLGDEDLDVTIRKVSQEEITKTEDKWVVWYEEVEKGMVLNKTNTKTISQLLGLDTDDWYGKRITLFATEVDFQGETVLAIRVRKRAPKAPASAKKGKQAVSAMAQDDAGDEQDIPF